MGLLVKTNKSENDTIQPMGIYEGRLRFEMLSFLLTAKIKLFFKTNDITSRAKFQIHVL